MILTEEARTRRIDAAITEAVGVDVPTDLEAKILARIADVQPQSSGRARWLAAAAVLLGSAIVFAVAGAQGNDPSAATQDPKPVRVTNEDTDKDVKHFDVVITEHDARQRLLGMGKLCEADFAIADDVNGKSKSKLKGLSAQAALRTIAADAGVPVAEFDGVVTIGVGQKLDPNKANVTLKAEKISALAFFKQLHARTGVNFVVGDDVVGNLALDVTDVHWRDLLDVVAKKMEFRVIGHGSVFAVTKRTRKVKQRVFFNFEDTALMRIVDVCAKISGLNIVVANGVKGNLTLTVRNANALETVRVAAACVGATVDAGQVLTIVPREAGATTTLTAESCKLAEELGKWIKVVPRASLTCEVEGTFAAFVDRASVRDLLRAAALATGHELYVDGDTFTIR